MASKKSDIKKTGFQSFEEFYPFYLAEHSNMTNRQLHVIGTSIVVIILTIAILTAQPHLLFYVPFVGYGFAWVGHFFFEKNKPATFKHPFYSLFGDFVMMKDVYTGRIKCF